MHVDKCTVTAFMRMRFQVLMHGFPTAEVHGWRMFHKPIPCFLCNATMLAWQRFNGVFGKVKQNLVRKGLLLMIETRKRSKSVSKLERWLFRFPPRFAEFLPPPFESTTGSSQAGDLRSDVLGRKLRKVVGGEPVDRESRDKRYTLTCANGRLRMGGVRFTADRLREWQRECWVTDLPVAEAKPGAERAPSGTSLVDAVIYLLGTLNESEWLGVERLSRPFEVFCGTPSNGAEICEAGWKWGCLVKQEIDGQTCYRLPGPGADAAAPEEYLDDGGSKGWTVDLDAVPYRDLEVLARIAELSPVRPGIAKLVVVPSLIGLGAAPADLLNEPLLEWLLERSAPFAEAIETVRQRRGKHLVHENLMIARVRDLSLKVEIQRSCKGGVVLLPNDYIAFPRASTKAVEKVVTKAGHAIKKRRRHG